MTDVVASKNGALIRLTEERWAHITEERAELAAMRAEVLETIARPMRVLEGGRGELLGVGEIEQGKALVVVNRETGKDGFVITAFLTRRMQSLHRRKQLWPWLKSANT